MTGHNYLNGTLFSKLNNIKAGDKIELTDKRRNTVTYEVYRTYVIDPHDLSILESEKENVRELTLVTCINGRQNRLIVKATEMM